MNLLSRIQNAIKHGKVEFWETRPENFTRTEFEEVINKNPNLSAFKMALRKSCDGVHGLDGEDYIYHGKISLSEFGKTKSFYLKFFFWPKNHRREVQGIEVQSFKKWGEKVDD